MDDPKIALAALREKIVSMNDKVNAAHNRVDKMEMLIRDDLKGINTSFGEISLELKEVVAWMNRSRGWAAAAVFISGILGGLISILATKFL